MTDHQALRSKIHNLTESLTVVEFIVELIEKKHYQFADDDAPHYLAELKKVALCIKDTRDIIRSLDGG